MSTKSKITHALSLQNSGCFHQAQAVYSEVLRKDPKNFDALHLLGVVKLQMGDLEAGIAQIRSAIKVNKKSAEAFLNLGIALRKSGCYADSIQSLKESINLKPQYIEAYFELGSVQRVIGEFDQALQTFRNLCRLESGSPEIHLYIGELLYLLRRPEESLSSFDQALELKADYPEAYNNRGLVLRALGRFKEALTSYETALKLRPDYAEAYVNLGNLLKDLKFLDKALACYGKAMSTNPEIDALFGLYLGVKTATCNWDGLGGDLVQYEASITAGKNVTTPFTALSLIDKPLLHLQAAKRFIASNHPDRRDGSKLPIHSEGEKIRIGYYSADFHNHATMYLMAELFEAHDAERFELYGFSFGPPRQDEMRARMATVFNQFYDVSTMSDDEIVQLSRDLHIDIAVDLKGFTGDSRTGIFAKGCAPIQVSYLGYPGTMGAEYIDYIIADKTVIPERHQAHYTEKVVYLPNSYQVNDSNRPISGRVYTRQEVGLPETGFVFCCFNNNYKILPATFDSWMRILKSVEGSVLWLLEDNPTAASNLRKEAEKRGVAPERLVFAQRAIMAEHLARHQLADLFLDTFPYNAHTTTSDALWAGLPVLTRMGESFASRVAASLLNALDMPELITDSQAVYEARAIELAKDSAQLAVLRQKLQENRKTSSLFDGKQFAKDLEAAFEQMVNQYRAGLPTKLIELPSTKNEPQDPMNLINQKLEEALRHHQRFELLAAKEIYLEILQQSPENFDALHLLGVVHLQNDDAVEAVSLISKALQINPDSAVACNNLGNALKRLNRFEEALASYNKAIKIDPGYADAYNNLGNIYKALNQLDKAVLSFERVHSINPKHVLAWYNKAIVLEQLEQIEQALFCVENAITLNPKDYKAHNNRALILKNLHRHEDSLLSFDRALALKPDYPEAYNNRGLVLRALGRFKEALTSYETALKLRPDYAEAYVNLGNLLKDLRIFDKALACYSKALTINPEVVSLLGLYFQAKTTICNWDGLEGDLVHYEAAIAAGKNVTTPFTALSLIDKPQLHLQAAKRFIASNHPDRRDGSKLTIHSEGEKIRIGYYSADFHNHATMYLMAELFEAHDAERFELYGFSFGPRRQDEMRARMASVFNQFYDVTTMSDDQIVQLSRDLHIDIAVDLKGFTGDSRTGIFAKGCAPIQVSYLGYPGTMGAEYIDYIIADKTVIPECHQAHYTEKVVYLPNSYQVNDSNRPISDRVYTRQEVGLPETGFVFCCFNNNYKILPATFDSWMRILKSVEGSVLWLLEDNPTAASNLRKEAEKRGVAPERLVFAQRAIMAEHLARHQLADLFLDTFPYNAHTTTSDALWAGLPVLTRMGESFASRVAASLLNALDMPELITDSQAVYEARAIELAKDSAQLAALRQKLQENRKTSSLFDGKQFAKDLEAAFAQMLNQYRAGLPTKSFSVGVNLNKLGFLGSVGLIEVLDIGASAINEVPVYKTLMDQGLGHLNAFEGDPRQIKNIQNSFGGNATIFNDFLYDGSESQLYIANASSGMTSLLKPKDDALRFFNRFTQFGKIEKIELITTKKLDDVDGLPQIDFAKLDVQGAELTILRNGTEKLRGCLAVQLEVSYIPLYENQPCFGEVDVWMRSMGYVPHCFLDVKKWSISPTIFNNNFRVPGNQLLESDIVYVRDPLSFEILDDMQLKKLAYLAHYCFKSYDLCGFVMLELEQRHATYKDSYARYLSALSA